MTTEHSTHPAASADDERPDETSDIGGGGASAEQREPAAEGSERLRILSMLSEGTITPDEAEQLLRALEPEPEPAGARSRRSEATGPRGVFGPQAFFRHYLGPHGPVGPPGPLGPHGPFGAHGPFGGPSGPGGFFHFATANVVGPKGAAAPGFVMRWDRPGAPVAPVPPATPTPPVPPIPPVPPFTSVEAPARTTQGRLNAARSVAFRLKEMGKELKSSLPLSLAKSADRFLPRGLRQCFERYEVDLVALLEVAEATDDEAIGVDGLDLFHIKDEGVELTIKLERAMS